MRFCIFFFSTLSGLRYCFHIAIRITPIKDILLLSIAYPFHQRVRHLPEEPLVRDNLSLRMT